MSADDLQERYNRYQAKHKTVSDRVATFRGRLDQKKKDYDALLKEITDAGYDPRTLKAARDEARAEADSELETAMAELEKIEAALNSYEQQGLS